MSRSLIKGPFVDRHLLKQILCRGEEKHTLTTWSRASTIVPIMIGQTIIVHNGREHFPLTITDRLVGQKIGEFVPTRVFRGHTSDKKGKR